MLQLKAKLKAQHRDGTGVKSLACLNLQCIIWFRALCVAQSISVTPEDQKGGFKAQRVSEASNCEVVESK